MKLARLFLALLVCMLVGQGVAVQRVQPARRGGPAFTFSGERALAHVRALVSLGPRPAGSAGIQRARAYILKQLRRARLDVEEISFTASTPRGRVPMANLVAKIPGKRREIIVLAGHYDTLPAEGFLGANDAGSSMGLLLELARVLAARENELTLWVVFFDGEEAIHRWGPRDGLYGSRYLSNYWQRLGVLPQIRALLLVDMIGDRDLKLRRDPNSTPWLVDLIWAVAHELGYGAHFADAPLAIEDDHIPFVRAGVPAVDLIDFEYGPNNRYWHTPEDTLDKLSARSLDIIGKVVLETVRRLERRWPARR